MKKKILFASIITAIFAVAQVYLVSVHEPAAGEPNYLFSLIASVLSVFLLAATFPAHWLIRLLLIFSSPFFYFLPVYGGNYAYVVLLLIIAGALTSLKKPAGKIFSAILALCAMLIIALPLIKNGISEELFSPLDFSGGVNYRIFSSTMPIIELCFLFSIIILLAFHKSAALFLTLLLIVYAASTYLAKTFLPPAVSIAPVFFLYAFYLGKNQETKKSGWFAKKLQNLEIVKLLDRRGLLLIFCLLPSLISIPNTILAAVEDINSEYSNFYAIENYIADLPGNAKYINADTATESELDAFLAEIEADAETAATDLYILGRYSRCANTLSGIEIGENWEQVKDFPAGYSYYDFTYYLYRVSR